MLAGKRILLGVTGSIAAYQAADLIGLLKNEMASVRVIMTRSATRFITPLTLAVISEHPVSVEMFEETKEPRVQPHYTGQRRTVEECRSPRRGSGVRPDGLRW